MEWAPSKRKTMDLVLKRRQNLTLLKLTYKNNYKERQRRISSFRRNWNEYNYQIMDELIIGRANPMGFLWDDFKSYNGVGY